MANPNPTPFKKTGKDANPNGRPKREWTWTGLLEDAMEEKNETGESYKKIVTQKLRELGVKGDMTAIKEILNRMDGMPQQKTDVTSGGKPIQAPILGGITKDDLQSNDSDQEVGTS